MEQELQAFRQADGKPYRLIALPMADPVEWEGERLPATYANFLIINGAVLLPYYKSPKDELAKKALQQAFPEREIIGINCLPLIKQHGSLHCVTMQYPEGVSFVIDKGSNDGLADDMNVIAGGGLVGRITSVGPNWSRVTSIISDNSNVSGMTLATGDNLIVSGDLQMMAQGVILFSKLVDSQDAVAEGDKVVTSDISDKYLPNILIGYISTINKDTNNLTKSGYLTPVVDFEHLSEVLVITDKKQQVPGGGADGE